jgi:hypothetical protein
MGPTVFAGNKREIPGDVPVMLWRDNVLELAGNPGILGLPWFHPWLEMLTPDELARMKAKAFIWRDVTGEWPKEIAWWWEIRMARRRGDILHMEAQTTAVIDHNGVLHCGYCEAKWSSNHDGSPHPGRCKLCDRIWVVIRDDREGGNHAGDEDAEYRE